MLIVSHSFWRLDNLVLGTLIHECDLMLLENEKKKCQRDPPQNEKRGYKEV